MIALYDEYVNGVAVNMTQLSMESTELAHISLKDLHLCSKDEQKSYRGTT